MYFTTEIYFTVTFKNFIIYDKKANIYFFKYKHRSSKKIKNKSLKYNIKKLFLSANQSAGRCL